MDFNNELHDDLFKLFILASNEKNDSDTYPFSIKEWMNHLIMHVYRFQYLDRSLADVEYEGNVFSVSNFPHEGYKKHYIKSEMNSPYELGKIKFRFEE